MDLGVAAAAAVHVLVERRETLASAESLTGGLHRRHDRGDPRRQRGVPGRPGRVCDRPQAHARRRSGTAAGGTRSRSTPDVARALATGTRERCGADWALATTGVAGPEPQDGKPVGLVYVAVAGPHGVTVRELRLSGSRASIRTRERDRRARAAGRGAARGAGRTAVLTLGVLTLGS